MRIKSPRWLSLLTSLLLAALLPGAPGRAAEATTQVRVSTNLGDFVIQGGGHDATTLQLKPTHDNVFNESGNGLQNKRGTVGLARGESAHSGNAQFYVNLVDNPDLDPVPTRWGYTVFGRVVQGMDVIEHIGETPTGTAGPFKSDSPL